PLGLGEVRRQHAVVMGQPLEVAAARMAEGEVVVGGGAEVAGIAEIAHPRIPCGVIAADLGCPVAGRVIAKNQLEVAQRLRERGPDGVLEKGFSVVYGYAHADEGHLGRGLGSLKHYNPLAIWHPWRRGRVNASSARYVPRRPRLLAPAVRAAAWAAFGLRKLDLSPAAGCPARPRAGTDSGADLRHDDAGGRLAAHLPGLIDGLLQRGIDPVRKFAQRLLQGARIDLEREREDAGGGQELRLAGEEHRTVGIGCSVHGHGRQAADRAGPTVGVNLLPIKTRRVETYFRKIALRC